MSRREIQNVFSSLRHEFDLWAQAGLTAKLWLRDDDAIEPTGQLARLTALADDFNIPILLAVVPEPATEELGQIVSANRFLDVAVHGYRHQNHAPAGQKSIELGGERTVDEICSELSWSLTRLHELFAGSATQILVPPWNRITPEVVKQLPELGFTALSTFAEASEAKGIPGLKQINTHLDIIDWRGNRGGRDPDWLVSELVKLLAEARIAGGRPIGVLTHHLVHDEIAWVFVENLFRTTVQCNGVEWSRAADLG